VRQEGDVIWPRKARRGGVPFIGICLLERRGGAHMRALLRGAGRVGTPGPGAPGLWQSNAGGQ
jgi:hypothetical protein